MKITILGARGSVPTDGKNMLEFGGATSCVLVETDDTALYLDAGTGIMSAPDLGDKNISIVLTHPHIDHMIGLPFFPALSKSGRRIDIYGSPRMGYTTKTQLERLLSPPLWPLFITDYPADTVIHDIDGDFNIGDIGIKSMESNHPGGGLVLRVEHGEKSVVLATDFEHDGEHIKMLTELYQYYIEHPEAMSGEYRELISRKQESVAQAVCDYLAGMTDQYSMEKFREIYIPKAWEVY